MSLAKTRFEEAQMYYTATFMGEHPEALDEAIAMHYASVAGVAMDMKRLVELRRFRRDDNCEQCVAYLREQIRLAHINAFGTEPNWPTARDNSP